MSYVKRTREGYAIRITGARKTDELFTHIHLGTVNVAQMIHDAPALVERGRVSYCTSPLSDTIKAFLIEARNLRQDIIDGMPPERRDMPIVMIKFKDGTHLGVDGNHRIARRLQDGLPDFTFFEFGEWAFTRYRVTHELSVQGTKRWLKLKPGQVLGVVWDGPMPG